MTPDNSTLSAQDQLQQLKARQYMQTSLESINKELDEVLEIIGSELDVSAEDELAQAGDSDSELNGRTREAMATAVVKLQQVSAALGMTSMTSVCRLVKSIETGLQKLVDRGVTPTAKQRRAIFSSFFSAVRYLSAMQVNRGEVASEISPVLTPGFYQLASAGLTEFVDEYSIAGIEFEFASDALKPLSAVEDIASLRRLRKMYQLALIGLLGRGADSGGGSDANEQLKLIAHVAERMQSDEQAAIYRQVWRLLAGVVAAVQENKIALSDQRRHFFSRYDALLRAVEKADGKAPDPDLAVRWFAEALYLLDLAGCREKYASDTTAFCTMGEVVWSEAEIEAKRAEIESGLKDALAATTSVINDIVVEIKHRLGLMAESEVCEEGDVEYLSTNIRDVAEVISFCGLSRLGSSVEQILPVVERWGSERPTQDSLLKVADSVLAIENALLSYSLCAESTDASSEPDAQAGLTQQANLHLFEELGANIELANRAISSYIDSNGDREHIANVADCLRAAVGGLRIVGAGLAADLLASCAKVVEQEYQSSIETDVKTMESLADSLISVDYMLYELASGRDGGAVLTQLLQQNLESVEGQLHAA